MIVADTSALVSLGTGDVIDHVLTEFEVHTTALVIEELEITSGYEDTHATAAQGVLDVQDRVTVHDAGDPEYTSARIDDGEASCIAIAAETGPEFFLTDDLRALPELQHLVDAQVAISPIVLKALVKRDVLTDTEAKTRLNRIARHRDRLGAPIYRRARQLFEQ